MRGGRNLLRLAHGIFDRRQDYLERLASQAGLVRSLRNLGCTGLHRGNRVLRAGLDLLDQIGDLLCLTAAALRELAHFVGDDSKASPVLTSARSLNGRIERQEIGLFGNIVDRFDHGADLVTKLAELLNGVGGLADYELDLSHRRGGFTHGATTMFGG